jgi:hypothetical protein
VDEPHPTNDLLVILLSILLGRDLETRRQGDKETRRQGDKETGRRGDRETGRQGDRETRRQGDKETRRQGDKETRRQGDKETRRQGDKETRSGKSRRREERAAGIKWPLFPSCDLLLRELRANSASPR